MLSDDVYRSKLTAVFSGIKRAAESLSDVADVEARQDQSRVRLVLTPHAHAACQLELMLHADQRYDIQIGSEFYEDCEIASLDDFEALIRAIAAGDVVTRHYFSAATGSLRTVETVVTLGNGREWHRSHRFSAARTPDEDGDATLVKDHVFLPYRR